MDDGPKISDRLRKVREHFGETQTTMSNKFNLGVRTWQKYELDGRPPNGRVLAELEKLGISVNWILTGVGEMLGSPTESSDSVDSYPALDVKLLSSVIRMVETWLSSNRRELSTDKKAQVIAELYAIALDDAGNRHQRLMSANSRGYLGLLPKWKWGHSMAELNTTEDNDPRKKKVKNILDEATPIPEVKTRRKSAKPAPVASIRTGDVGDGSVVGNGNTVTTFVNTKPPRPKVIVQTGDGVINAEQKQELLERVKEIAELEVSLKRNPRPIGSVITSIWSTLNKAMKVNSYHEIPSGKFEDAKKKLVQMKATLNRKPSAKRKNPSWRQDRIAAIQARCNQLNCQDRRKDYMVKAFGKDSLTKLTDDQIEQCYNAVFSW